MRPLLIATLSLLAGPLCADEALSPTAATPVPAASAPASAAPAPAAANPAAASPVAATALSPVAAVATSLSPVAATGASSTAAVGSSPTAEAIVTAAPTPTATPFVPMKGPEKGIKLVPARWAMALKLGGAIPMGDLGLYNNSGPAANLDLYYHADDSISIDTFAAYSRQSYKAGDTQPLDNVGLGIKMLYNLTNLSGVIWYAGAGLAGYYNQRTKQVIVDVVNNKAIFAPTYDTSMGLGVLGVAGARYEYGNGLGLILEMNVVNINLAGGTSDNILLGQPLLGLSYTF